MIRLDANGAEVGPDEGGLLSGTAIQDEFVLSTGGWLDDDLPLLYRFKTNVAVTQETGRYLNDFTFAPEITATLSAGRRNENFTIAAIAEVKDDVGAVTSASMLVQVQPYAVPDATSLTDIAKSVLGPANAVGDTQRVNQIVQALVDVLPTTQAAAGNATLGADAMATRGLLVDVLIGVTVTGESVERVSQTLNAITGNARQLSSQATDRSLNFASDLVANYSGQLQQSNLETMLSTMSSLLTASSQQFADGSVTAESNVQARSATLSNTIGRLSSSLAGELVAGEFERSVATESFGMHAKKGAPRALENSTIGDGKVTVPAGALAVAAHEASIASHVVEYTHANPLFFATAETPEGGPTAAKLRTSLKSVWFTGSSGEELKIQNLTTPFIIKLNLPSSYNGNQINESAGCAYWNTYLRAWVHETEPVERSDRWLACAFDHLTDFGGFLGPKNELASAQELLELDTWANNLLGLAVVLTLLCTTLVTLSWSLRAYTRDVRRTGRVVAIHGVSTATHYARGLVATSYAHASRLKQVVFKLRTNSVCGPLLFFVKGDPYVRSQRLVLVLITLLAALFFTTLFFSKQMDPVCTDAAQSVCKSYTCPSCYELYGVADCGGPAAPDPAEICSNYRSSSSMAAAHERCESRPLVICRLQDGKTYADPEKRDDQDFCPSGVLITVAENYVQASTGDTVGSSCTEYSLSLGVTILRALFTACCTLPVIMVLDKMFSRLRSPHERAIMGEFHSSSADGDGECFLVSTVYKILACCKAKVSF